MKGFPNQVADLKKLVVAIQALARLVNDNQDAKDDGVFGQELVRVGVAGTGHTPKPVEQYLSEQLRKTASNQSFRTTARGLRELFRLLGFIDDSGERLRIRSLGLRAATFAETPMNGGQINFWRTTIRNMTHGEVDNDLSHPYQVLLRLVARRPGITRAKCALALEAHNDSDHEMDRIVALCDLSEEEIRRQIKVTKANWDNAKKVLPRFAEQLRDVIRVGQQYFLADAPGYAEDSHARTSGKKPPQVMEERAQFVPRTSREVTPDTIGRAGRVESFDELETSTQIDPVSAQRAVEQRLERLRRHNVIVHTLASRLDQAAARLFENPFDILALVNEIGFLVEVKTLDGSLPDERARVQEALAQLLYYEAFVTARVVGESKVHKIACFERRINTEHEGWLARSGIGTMWCLGGDRFGGNELACRALSSYLEELA